MKLQDREGNDLPIMGHPMGPADFSTNDFLAKNPVSGEIGLAFGIDPTDVVELTVINLFGKTVTHTFQPGPNPYLIKAIKQQIVAATVNYYI
jgi:hypothetical protein